MRRSALILTQLLGVGAFAYPFLIQVRVGTVSEARASEAPWLIALLVPLLLATTLGRLSSGKMSSKTIALLGVLAACAAALRLPISFAGANLFFLVPILGGAAFGSVFGFLLGSVGMLASAIVTGGVGPWLPFQMWAAGWVGWGAGVTAPLMERLTGRWRAVPLAIYGSAAAFFYGVAMNLYFWPVVTTGPSSISWDPAAGAFDNLARFTSFYLLTSAAWDAMGALLNAVLLIFLGPAAIDAMLRFKRRSEFTMEGHDLALEPFGEPKYGSVRNA